MEMTVAVRYPGGLICLSEPYSLFQGEDADSSVAPLLRNDRLPGIKGEPWPGGKQYAFHGRVLCRPATVPPSVRAALVILTKRSEEGSACMTGDRLLLSGGTLVIGNHVTKCSGRSGEESFTPGTCFKICH